MRHSRIDDPDFMGMLAAMIHSGNPNFSVKDSVNTAFDLQNEVERRCYESRERIEAELKQQPQRNSNEHTL